MVEHFEFYRFFYYQRNFVYILYFYTRSRFMDFVIFLEKLKRDSFYCRLTQELVESAFIGVS